MIRCLSIVLSIGVAVSVMAADGETRACIDTRRPYLSQLGLNVQFTNTKP